MHMRGELMMYFLLGIIAGMFITRLYWWILSKIAPNLDWWTDRPKYNFWRFWK